MPTYESCTAWALAYVKIQREMRGDKFATEREYKFMVEDIWAWTTLWWDAFKAAFNTKLVPVPDHRNNTIHMV